MSAAPQTSSPGPAPDADLAKPLREFDGKRADPPAPAPGATEVQQAGAPPEPVRPPPERTDVTAAKEPAPAAPQPPAAAPDEANAAPAGAEAAAGARSDQAVAPLGNDAASHFPPAQPPRPAATPAAGAMTAAAVAAPDTIGTVPHSRAAGPSAADTRLVDWGDEGQLVAALRADWRATPVVRTFRVGQQVPADIPLQALPQPYAGRDHGLTLRYLMANGDAVLVLPTLRVVVEVYSGSAESTR